MKDLFEQLSNCFPTKAEVNALINDPEVIEKTADQIIDIMFDTDVDREQLEKLGVYLEAEEMTE